MSDEALDMLARQAQERKASHGDISSERAQSLEVTFNETSRALLAGTMGPLAHRNSTACLHHSLDNKHEKTNWLPSQGAVESTKPADKDTGTPPSNDHPKSRRLTKKQLSDMAFGIREMSKRLSHIKLKLNVRNIFIQMKTDDKVLPGKAAMLVTWLLGNPQYTVWVQDLLKDSKRFDYQSIVGDDESKKSRLCFWNEDTAGDQAYRFDIILGLGGDGTVLYCSKLFQKIVPPTLSFALGSLGFLTKFDFESFKTILPRAFDEGISVNLRLRFEATIVRAVKREGESDEDFEERNLTEELIGSQKNDSTTHKIGVSQEGARKGMEETFTVLNEFVLDRGPQASMAEVMVFGDDNFFTTVHADGVVVATPTGSTAYNLSAGGSLCHPDNPVMLLTAIAPHALNFRPIILPDTMVLRVGVAYNSRYTQRASFDGKNSVELNKGDYVTISASRYPFPFVLPQEQNGEDWIESISRALTWNKRAEQKPFTREKKEDGDEKKDEAGKEKS